ncbi:hypothetical protein [uncultured Akkermansia sp.]|uniref:hypothetical protein n=2 Tax=uncultured Akkermansia sp. TaxID=512294 RepID=UPI00262EEE32|nr:hypothetical protein [uncultured Akkermansia sp.]
MNNSEIQIQFPRPGNWQEFTLTPIYQDKGGYRPPARFTQGEIPAEQAPAMQAVVAALVGLSEPWQAVQVWARLGKNALTLAEDGTYTLIDAVSLTVEAVHAETKGRRIFTASDYPAFIITDPAAVSFFNFFTTPTNNNIIK